MVLGLTTLRCYWLRIPHMHIICFEPIGPHSPPLQLGPYHHHFLSNFKCSLLNPLRHLSTARNYSTLLPFAIRVIITFKLFKWPMHLFKLFRLSLFPWSKWLKPKEAWRSLLPAHPSGCHPDTISTGCIDCKPLPQFLANIAVAARTPLLQIFLPVHFQVRVKSPFSIGFPGRVSLTP